MDKKLTFGQFLLSLLGKEKKHFKNLLKLLLERTWNIIIESLFEMVKIGTGFGWFVWVSSRNEFYHNILVENFFVEYDIKLRKLIKMCCIPCLRSSFGVNCCVFDINWEHNISKIFFQIFSIFNVSKSMLCSFAVNRNWRNYEIHVLRKCSLKFIEKQKMNTKP